MSATDPSPQELAGFQAPPHADPQGVLAAATLPSPAELARLKPRRAPRVQVAWRAWVSAGMLLLFFLVLPRGPGPVMLEQGVPTVVDDGIFLGRDIRSEGSGTLRLIQAGAQGTVVELEAGTLRFDVDPDGLYTDLTVWAGGARFMTQGASFTLSSDAELSVLSGAVRVQPSPGEEERQVLEDQRWSPPGLVDVDRITQLVPAGEELVLQPTPDSRPSPPRTPAPLPPAPSAEQPSASEQLVQEQLDLEQADFEALMAARARRGEETGALADAFLERWDSSPLRPEVEAIALSAAMADPTLDPVALLAQVDRWLGANPRHPRFVEMHYLRATLLRDQLHDCEAAIVSYRVVIALGGGPQQAQAERYLQACQQAR